MKIRGTQYDLTFRVPLSSKKSNPTVKDRLDNFSPLRLKLSNRHDAAPPPRHNVSLPPRVQVHQLYNPSSFMNASMQISTPAAMNSMKPAQSQSPAMESLMASLKAKEVDVPMGEQRTAKGQERLSTSGLSDCTAVVFMSNKDPATGIYRDRTMLHVTGSYLGSASMDANGQSRPAGAVLQDLMANQKGHDHKLIIGFGTDNKSSISQEMFMDQSHGGAQVMEQLKALCGGNVVIPPAGSSLSVMPDGSVRF